jgi:16S rRNA (adenine(1408)-N(1))-methyltransferase
VGSIEASGLEAIADDVTVSFPWGTLLDAVLGSRPDVLASVARVAKSGAPVRVLVSAIERDGRSEIDLVALGRLRGIYREAGLEITGTRAATRADIDAACSSWGKRLGAGRWRPAFVIAAVRR